MNYNAVLYILTKPSLKRNVVVQPLPSLTSPPTLRPLLLEGGCAAIFVNYGMQRFSLEASEKK